MLSSSVLLSTDQLQAYPCDPPGASLIQVSPALEDQPRHTSVADDPQTNPVPVTSMQLLQAIDVSPRYLVLLSSGKPLSEHQDEDVGAFHVFGRDKIKSPAVSMQMLKAFGWKIDVIDLPESHGNENPRRSKVKRKVSKGPALQIVYAQPPVNKSEQLFQSFVIPLRNANIHEVSRALREMPFSRGRSQPLKVVSAPSTNSVVLISAEPSIIKRCKRLIEQMENVANKKRPHPSAETPATTEGETVIAGELKTLRTSSVDDLAIEESLACEEIEVTFDSTSNIIAQIIKEMQNSSARPKIVSASNSKRESSSFTIHSYSAQFANNSVANHLALIEKIRTKAPHLVFDLLEIKNNAKKNNRDTDLCSLKLRLTSYSSVKSETESE
ncbi:MAG: secretin N-terminal domain-containing protein [Planctomycetota bacterium]